MPGGYADESGEEVPGLVIGYKSRKGSAWRSPLILTEAIRDSAPFAEASGETIRKPGIQNTHLR